ncbi:YciI family protein [Oryzobacter telluris]|uniref:YciI family protein n=1 Tax=Oryzobacter telluris TaxID=3149179 RepID=UPI00370D6AC3
MRYLVLIASDPGDWERATPEERQGYFDAHDAFERALAAQGTKVSGAPLASADTATTLRHEGDRLTVTDGPFVELVEQVAGFYLVDLPDLDAAVSVCAHLPRSYAVEIRPTIEIEGYEPPRDL